MSERLAPWRARPTQEVLELLQQLQGSEPSRCYVMQRAGPTSFIVREESCDVNRKVTIGCRPTCSCSPVGTAASKELCLHILFVMVKVLRVPASNPLAWQLSLTDRELEEVLRYAALPQQPPPPPPDEAKKPAAPKGAVKRKPVDEEDPCPICYEDMVGCHLENLVWCKNGCGRNIHGKCMSVWSNHQMASLSKELTCPLCRSDWGPFTWKPVPASKLRKPRETRQDIHYGTRCGACRKAPLTGKRFKCLACADYDLCESCFNGGHHPQHPFACKENPTAFATPAERAAMMPMITRLGATALAPASGAAPSAASAATAAAGHAARGDADSAVPSEHSGVQGQGEEASVPASAGHTEPSARLGNASASPSRVTGAAQVEALPTQPRAAARRRRSPAVQAAAAAAEAREAAAAAAAEAAARADVPVSVDGAERAVRGIGGGLQGLSLLANEEVGGLGTLTASPAANRLQGTQRPAPNARPRLPRRRSASSTSPVAGLDLVVGSGTGAPIETMHAHGAQGAGAARVHRGLVGLPRVRGAQQPGGRGRAGASDDELLAILEGRPLGGHSPASDAHGVTHGPAAAAAATAAAARAAAAAAEGRAQQQQLQQRQQQQQFGVSGHSIGPVGAESADGATPLQHPLVATGARDQGQSHGHGTRAAARPPRWTRPGLAAPHGHSDAPEHDAFHLDGRSVAPRTGAVAVAATAGAMVWDTVRVRPAGTAAALSEGASAAVTGHARHAAEAHAQQSAVRASEAVLASLPSDPEDAPMRQPQISPGRSPSPRRAAGAGAASEASGSCDMPHDARYSHELAGGVHEQWRPPSNETAGGAGLAAAFHLRRSVSAGAARTSPGSAASVSVDRSSADLLVVPTDRAVAVVDPRLGSPELGLQRKSTAAMPDGGSQRSQDLGPEPEVRISGRVAALRRGSGGSEVLSSVQALHVGGRLAENQDNVLLASTIGLVSNGMSHTQAISEGGSGQAVHALPASAAADLGVWNRLFSNPVFNTTPTTSLSMV